MKRLYSIASIATMLLSTTVYAQSYTDMDANKQVTKDALSCMVYYDISRKCTMSASPEIGKSAENLAEFSGEIGTKYAFMSGQHQSNILSLGKEIAKEQKTEISSSCVNIHILTDSHAYCKTLLSNPEEYKQNILNQHPKSIPVETTLVEKPVENNVYDVSGIINQQSVYKLHQQLSCAKLNTIFLHVSFNKEVWGNHLYLYNDNGIEYLNLSDKNDNAIYSFKDGYLQDRNGYNISGSFHINVVDLHGTTVYLFSSGNDIANNIKSSKCQSNIKSTNKSTKRRHRH